MTFNQGQIKIRTYKFAILKLSKTPELNTNFAYV